MPLHTSTSETVRAKHRRLCVHTAITGHQVRDAVQPNFIGVASSADLIEIYVPVLL